MNKVLMWDKPQKVLSVADWKDSYGFEDGPTGGYVPNMSSEDAARWKAKLVGKTTTHPQVEIRKSKGSTQLTVVVSLGTGYNYKYYKAVPKRGEYETQGVNVHVALNGGLQLTFEELDEFYQAVQEARHVLEELRSNQNHKAQEQDT